MNINPISFGRIARINAPRAVAEQAVKLINQPEVDRNHPEIQEYLKEMFYDYRYGAALLVQPREDEFYIMTGEDANKARMAKERMEDKIALACERTDCLEAYDAEVACIDGYRSTLDYIISGPHEFPEEICDENTSEEEAETYYEAYHRQQDILDKHEYATFDFEYDENYEITDVEFHFEK